METPLDGYYNSHRSRISVAADDFGVSPRANRNILYLVDLGKLDRVSVMVHGQISEKEVDELMRSGVKIDIHLDILNEFHDNRRKRTSSSKRVLEFITDILTRKLSSKKVAADWKNQIEKFHDIFGKYPDGINSHEHVHFFPPFFKIALAMQNDYSIPYIRFGDSVSMPHHTMVAHILHWLRIINMKACLRSGCVSSNSLISLDWIKNVDKFLNNLPEGTLEIACHPELANDFVRVKKYF
ncbi:MAG TPA: ChbG/HpnK family deacetylase [Patescibacteria group bacterium]